MTLGNLYKKSILELSPTSPTPDLDTRVLFEHVLSRNTAYLLAHPEVPLTNAQYSRIRRLVSRRKSGQPIAYITGHKELYGLDFLVNKNVLIPRPETENLIEEAIKFVSGRWSVVGGNPLTTNHKPLTILDVGTGSGCIIISLAKQLASESVSHYCQFYAADISKKALAVAKKNAKHLLSGVISSHSEPALGRIEEGEKSSHKGIRFFHSDLFSNKRLPKKFDLVMANLPYVPYSRKPDPESTIKFEPKIAIFAGDNGSEVIKRFILESRDRLKPGGLILLELDPRNAEEIEKFAKKIFPSAKVELSKDLAKRERYLKIC